MLEKKPCALIVGKDTEKIPEITIAIPTYKRADLLKKAVDSALNQKNYEKYYAVFVIDNEAEFEGEVSETEKLMKTYHDERLFYYRNKQNVGMDGNWNQCIALPNSKWVAMLHDDDCLDENYLERISYYLEKYPDAKCMIPNKREINAQDEILKAGQHKKNKRLTRKLRMQGVMKKSQKDDIVWGCNHYGAPTIGVIFDKKCAEAIGGFDESIRILADWDFFIRFRDKYSVYSLNEILASYRWAVNFTYECRGEALMEFLEEQEQCLEQISRCSTFRNERKQQNWLERQKLMLYVEYWNRLGEEYEKKGIHKPGIVKTARACYWAVVRRIYAYFRVLYR